MKLGDEFGRIFFEQDRITRFGSILRKFHLDELPELFLIFLGKMSFVGPRPLPQKLIESLNTNFREKVKPGWTGPAQIWLLKNGILPKRLQIKLDNMYVRKKSLKYNLKLLTATLYSFVTSRKLIMDKNASNDRINFNKKIQKCRNI